MIPALTKPIDQVVADDIAELIQRKWPESENVEYKGELPRDRNNQPDAWYSGESLSDPSKKKIFKELVAFANRSGGRLFVGIAETVDRPPRAREIKPVPRCCELAERLEQAIINSIDPPLSFFRVFGVKTEADGSGVVVADVSASYNGPHRSLLDLQCYVRKGTNSVPVAMREVHDIVMRLSRRQDEIRQRLAERQTLFHYWFGRRSAKIVDKNLVVGFRVTAVPEEPPLHLEKVFRNTAVSGDLREVSGQWVYSPGNSPMATFRSPQSNLSERPVLGGTRWDANASEKAARQEIFRDGLIDLWFKWSWPWPWSGTEGLLRLEWIISLSANAVFRVGSFRYAVQAPACEYALQIELLSSDGHTDCPVGLVDWANQKMGSSLDTPTILGPYSIGDRDKVVNLIIRDLYEAAGEPTDDPVLPLPTLEISWSALEAGR